MDKQLTILLSNDVPLEMIWVEAGHFIMGSEAERAEYDEGPEHLIHITEPFYIGKYPVTQAQWWAVMGNNPSGFPRVQRPVEEASWFDFFEGNQDKNSAPAFLTLINKYVAKERTALSATHTFRLPTEAEWEYAAKGGALFSKEALNGKRSAELYPAFVGGDRLASCGWFSGNSSGATRPVGLKAPNELGLYDMSGNVREWCYDWFDGYTYSNRKAFVTTNPTGPDSGDDPVLRGGSCNSLDWHCLSTHRRRGTSAGRNGIVGFRLVLGASSGSGTSGYL